MPKRSDLPTTQKLPIPAPGDTAALEHAQRWLAHVEAGRIGSPLSYTPTSLINTRSTFPHGEPDHDHPTPHSSPRWRR